MAAGERLKTEKSGVIYSVSLERVGGGGGECEFFLFSGCTRTLAWVLEMDGCQQAFLWVLENALAAHFG